MINTTLKPFPRTKYWEICYSPWQDITEHLLQHPHLIQIKVGKWRNHPKNLYFLKNNNVCILTNEHPQGNVCVDLAMRISEKLRSFRTQKFFATLLESVKRAACEKNLKELVSLDKLCEEMNKKNIISELSFLNHFLRNEQEILRFAKYIQNEQREGILLAKNVAKWINNPAVQIFKNTKALYVNFNRNRDSFGEAWYKKWQFLKSKEEYLMIIQQIIGDSNTKKMMWNAPKFFGKKPILCYFYRKNQQRPIIITINGNGFIQTAEVLREIWQDILVTKYMDNFYKIDNFFDELLMPVQ